MNIQSINTFFDELNEIHEKRYQYSLEWAFEDAQTKLDSFSKNTIDKKLKRQCLMCKDKVGIQENFNGLQKQSRGIIQKTKWYRRIFSNLYMVLNLVEILISIGLVLGLSHLSHSGEVLIESEMISFWFVFVFAFLKVVIEKHYIQPRMEAWGWSLYAKSAQNLREITVALSQQVIDDNKTQSNVVSIEQDAESESKLENTFRTFAKDFMIAEA